MACARRLGRPRMTKVDEIKGAICSLSDAEKTELKRWLDEFDAQAFDDKIEADAAAGRLDALVAKARAHVKAGRTTPL